MSELEKSLNITFTMLRWASFSLILSGDVKPSPMASVFRKLFADHLQSNIKSGVFITNTITQNTRPQA